MKIATESLKLHLGWLHEMGPVVYDKRPAKPVSHQLRYFHSLVAGKIILCG